MIQDGEFVLGPADAGFDTAAYLQNRASPLASYTELARGRQRPAAEIIDFVAQQHSISPRLLLALLEFEQGWVGGGAGPAGGPTDLFSRVSMLAAWLADGYYGLKYRSTTDLSFADGSRGQGPTEGGAGHFAVARYLARGADAASLPGRLASFAEAYDRLFGPTSVVDAPIPADGLDQPPFLLPWEEGQRWHYTGGPHGAWGIATAWGAVDFAPPTMVGCRAAPEWVIAAAPGLVTWSEDGLVLVDMDGDGFSGTGWVLAYLHMATEGRVPVGTVLQAGDHVGHPSCEGGVADGAHVHFTRRYNGEWLPAAGGPAPMDLSGWTFTSYGAEYDGSMAHPSQGTRMAVTSRRPGETEVASNNGPTRRAELAEAWASAIAAGVERPAHAAAQAPPTTPPDEAVASSVGQQPSQSAAATAGPSLSVTLALHGRGSPAGSIVIGLERPGAPPSVLMGELDAEGASGAIPLPEGIHGIYTVVVRVPGFLPAEHQGVELGAGPVAIDFTAGGIVALEPGDLNHDRNIDAQDLAAWARLWWRGSASADLDGNGSGSLRDLPLLLRRLGEGDS